jgi:pimeloyl-ACP methyl ester carboxylesterase
MTKVNSQAQAHERATLKMVKTPALNIGYEETGLSSGRPILLLHGWRYDPRSFDNVVAPLADAGYRVIVPYSRCFGPTTVYRSPDVL